MQGAGGGQVFRFGVFQADTRSGELFKHGLRIRVQDQPFQVLLALLESPSEVVTREALRRRLWPQNTYVDFDHSLNIAINKLRDALGDSADNPRFIETLPRRGYRFLAPVQIAAAQPSPAEAEKPQAGSRPSPAPAPSAAAVSLPAPHPQHIAGRPWVRGIILAVLILAGLGAARWLAPRILGSTASVQPHKQMLAVLPFQNLTEDPAQEYFISGLTEEIIAQLGRMRATRLGVIARTSVQQYRGAQKPIAQIGQELNVDYVLEGSVRLMRARPGQRAPDRVRIAVQLVKASDQVQLWSEQFEREVADVFAIQTDVARRVADSLALELLPAEATALGRAATSDMAAYEAYLRGRFYWNRRTEEDFLKGVVYFEDAIRRDPKYAQAYAGLADCYNLLGGYAFQPPARAFPKAQAAAARALELNPALAEAHASMAFTQFYFDWDWKGAQESFRRAIQLNPNYAPARQWHGEFLHASGRLEEAAAELRRALELDPFSLPLNDDLGWVLLSQGKHRAAIEQFRATQQLDPRWPSAYLSLAFALARDNRHMEALAQIERARELVGDPMSVVEVRGYVNALAGHQQDAAKAIRTLEERRRTIYVSLYNLALIHTGLGQKEEALNVLEAGLKQREIWLVWLKTHPEWDSLRREPRFAEILKRVGF
jgi:TolB-like protein/DNA-binding winged helix-turn-helix (wHTH) protein/Flp pilus assembly protein TadD